MSEQEKLLGKINQMWEIYKKCMPDVASARAYLAFCRDRPAARRSSSLARMILRGPVRRADFIRAQIASAAATETC